jgi:hypothetical protein
MSDLHMIVEETVRAVSQTQTVPEFIVRAKCDRESNRKAHAVGTLACTYILQNGRTCGRPTKSIVCKTHTNTKVQPKCLGEYCIRRTSATIGYCTQCPDGITQHKKTFSKYVSARRTALANRL